MTRETETINVPESILGGLIERYRELLHIQEEIAGQEAAHVPQIALESVSEHISDGRPILYFDDFFPGWDEAGPVFHRVARWVSEGLENPDNPENRWPPEMEAGLFRELALAWYNSDSSCFSQMTPESARLVAVVGASIKPFLQAHTGNVMKSVNQTRWRRRYCPACGGYPDFAYLAKEDGCRWLVCSRCDSEWQYQRLECPFCGSQDQSDLSYITDPEGLYRVYLCEKCKGYLKAIDLRTAKTEVSLPLERFYTLELDEQARKKGYSR